MKKNGNNHKKKKFILPPCHPELILWLKVMQPFLPKKIEIKKYKNNWVILI